MDMGASILINDKPPNLFRQLLAYRPRESNTPRENFLTESFSFVLASDPAVAKSILQAFVGNRFVIKRLLALTTQAYLTCDEEEGWSLPDMMADVELEDGGRAQVWMENKWDSAADAGQLREYLRKLEQKDKGVPKHLVLLTPRHTDAVHCPKLKLSTSVSHESWSRIHEVIRSHPLNPMTRDFEAFLATAERLVVRPITLAQVREYRRASEANEAACASRLREHLYTLCDRVCVLLPDGTFTADRRTVVNYGRAGIWSYDSRLTFGLLFDPTDHRTAFLNPERPLDLFLRIEGPYKGKREAREAMRSKLAPLVRALEADGFACDQGNWRSNGNTLLLAHDGHPFPFEATADEQVQWVFERFCVMLDFLNKRQFSRIVEQVLGYSN
jgi:hypothetical protein